MDRPKIKQLNTRQKKLKRFFWRVSLYVWDQKSYKTYRSKILF